MGVSRAQLDLLRRRPECISHWQLATQPPRIPPLLDRSSKMIAISSRFGRISQRTLLRSRHPGFSQLFFTASSPANLSHSNISIQPQSNRPSSIPFAKIISTPTQSIGEDSHARIIKPTGIKIMPSVVEQIERVRKIDNKPKEVLRLSVESGGCHGFQYKMAFTDSIGDDDFLFTIENRDGLIVVDESSLELMDGSTVDFATELIGSSFRIVDNPQSAGKGCGCGVSWELK
ncbi:hypothetical protein O181_027522 [Austropuccinia psidii MF-1]|uniref:Core domain-containing protein n=1 Tax=Austropuccinia psidii MF-1 TaxID=1389203 RepID=A0A9Q3CQ67_9BASI|nr:hypothetical protein [Austropuccinia psidii MF-1]